MLYFFASDWTAVELLLIADDESVCSDAPTGGRAAFFLFFFEADKVSSRAQERSAHNFPSFPKGKRHEHVLLLLRDRDGRAEARKKAESAEVYNHPPVLSLILPWGCVVCPSTASHTTARSKRKTGRAQPLGTPLVF